MKRSVEITTPIPSADRVAARLGMSKNRQRILYDIVNKETISRKKTVMSKGLDGRHRDENGQISEKHGNT